jgi:hypothetical protein
MPREETQFRPVGAEPLAARSICCRLPQFLDDWLRQRPDRSAVIRAALWAEYERQQKALQTEFTTTNNHLT